MHGGKVVALAVACLALAGCTAQPTGPTLTDTKVPVQLLRNNAWSRMPAIMLNDAIDTIDESNACLETEEDPTGTLRSWTSGTVALINNSFAARVDTIALDLADSFVEQGWEATTTTNGGTVRVSLIRPPTLARIQIEATEKDAEVRAQIAISVTGPCVRTGGVESDEVLALEELAHRSS